MSSRCGMQRRFGLIISIGIFASLLFFAWLASNVGARMDADYYLSQAEGRIVDLTECDNGVLVRLDSSEDTYWFSRDVLEKSIQFERGDDQTKAPSWMADSGVDLLLHAKEETCGVVLLFHQTSNEAAERKVESALIRLS